MTTPTPNSDFTVPPGARGPSGFDIGQLPPMPPPPREVRRALALTAVAVIVSLIGGVWQAIAVGAELGEQPRPEEVSRAFTWLFGPLLYGGIAAVIGWFMWRGYRVGLWLFVLGAAFALLRPLVMVWWLVVGLIREHSAAAMVDQFLDGPGGISQFIAVMFAVPVLLLLIKRPVWRWSRKADAIRVARGLAKRGAPIRQLPPALYD